MGRKGKEEGRWRKFGNEEKENTADEEIRRFEVFTAVTMKNCIFWNVKTQFVLHRKHYFSVTELSRLM
jgi:hypothetical protein